MNAAFPQNGLFRLCGIALATDNGAGMPDVPPSDEAPMREALRLQRAAARDGYLPPEHKPDKRARRLIRALGDIDAS